MCAYVGVCVKEAETAETTSVCASVLTGVSFPGMNNSNERSGDHANLVILFSMASLRFSSPPSPLLPPTTTTTAAAAAAAAASLEQENKLEQGQGFFLI